MSPAAEVAQVYRQFSAYPCPASPWVCEQCGPQWSADDIRATPLRKLSLPQLVAVHVMAADDDALRYYFPRLMELMLEMQAPVFDFRMSYLSHRLPGWRPEESAAVRGLAEAVWSELADSYPPALGYFSDIPTALDLLVWCGLPVVEHLDLLRADGRQSAALHLADLVDAVCSNRDPFESASRATVVEWMRGAITGERLEHAFFAADSPEVARQLSAAHELWTVCCR